MSGLDMSRIYKTDPILNPEDKIYRALLEILKVLNEQNKLLNNIKNLLRKS
jgi:hypothetical protein